MAVFLPDLGEEGTSKALDELKKLLEENSAKVTAEDLWGLRDFAYTIKKHDQGYYVVLNLEMDPEKLPELEKPLNLNKELLRFMFVKLPKNYTFKTLAEYEEEAEKEAEELAKEKAEKEEAKARRNPKRAPRPAKTAPKKEEKKEEVKEVKKEKKIEKLVKPDLSEVDKKLKSIIDDPDITL